MNLSEKFADDRTLYLLLGMFVAFHLVAIPIGYAQTELNSNDDLPTPLQPRTSIDDLYDLPDSPLWGLDVALDNIRLQLATNTDEKTRVGLEIAEERLLEIRVMILENKLDKANDAKTKHDEVITELETRLNIEDEIDSEEEAEEKLREKTEIKIRLDEHKTKIKFVAEELTEQNKTRIHNILDEQDLQSFFDGLEGDIEELKIEVKDGETKIKTKLRTEFGTTEIEIEQKISSIKTETREKIRIELEHEDDEDDVKKNLDRKVLEEFDEDDDDD